MELLPLADPSEMEAEEDVFFADLSRQLALLVMDDEEQLPVHMQCPPLPLRELPYMPQIMMPPSSHGYDQVAYRREMSKGTGVFIPRSTSAPRRKNRSRNKCSPVEHYNFPRQHLQKTATTISHVSNGAYCSHSSVLIKRHVEQP
ncbi:uncharacterized protein LOC122012575 [Zingiber officinale]|uniref:Uncharacterized protein n=1 Tax=Zingiber officinale TaxID=94328 RepID=A0A8J5KIQ5_ZINOF|nr:uncharacterized protein LOC122012575 [Zingiber officinale]KAG6485103.1 hypothetical protein ZIOFF_053632 [Zingiber officinale]